MSSYGPTNNVTAIETDMRDVLRERKARLSDVIRDAGVVCRQRRREEPGADKAVGGGV